MSWIRENGLSLAQMFAVKVLKTGKIPRHIAFIMDGNRRYARKVRSEKVIEGHTKGFDKLAETLQWCLDLGIPEVTVYAFSIENFKRSKEEVDDLMNLVRQKFKRLLDEREKLQEKGVRIRILGNLALLPEDVCALISEAMDITQNNDKAFLNIAMSYTSRDEITRAVKSVAKGYQNGDIQLEDIDEELINNCLDSDKSPPPDLLIRTSGEVRLSDFLLWQTSNTYLHFVETLWPEFSIWDLLTAVFYYQRSYEKLEYMKIQSNDENTMKSAFAKKVHQQRLQELLAMRKVEVDA